MTLDEMAFEIWHHCHTVNGISHGTSKRIAREIFAAGRRAGLEEAAALARGHAQAHRLIGSQHSEMLASAALQAFAAELGKLAERGSEET
jgi:hypothetical protein